MKGGLVPFNKKNKNNLCNKIVELSLNYLLTGGGGLILPDKNTLVSFS